MGYRTDANLQGIRAELELSFIVTTAVTFQSRNLQRCHQVSHAELQVHVPLSSEFLALTGNKNKLTANLYKFGSLRHSIQSKTQFG